MRIKAQRISLLKNTSNELKRNEKMTGFQESPPSKKKKNKNRNFQAETFETPQELHLLFAPDMEHKKIRSYVPVVAFRNVKGLIPSKNGIT